MYLSHNFHKPRRYRIIFSASLSNDLWEVFTCVVLLLDVVEVTR